MLDILYRTISLLTEFGNIGETRDVGRTVEKKNENCPSKESCTILSHTEHLSSGNWERFYTNFIRERNGDISKINIKILIQTYA
jgi:hypothetical protein